ncbi:hypothetical protein LXJ58_33665, partial [Escherichia coli]|nr:hypothetical protein [Escherichia coli]
MDAIDAPLAEEREAYRVRIVDADGRATAIETTAPQLRITAAAWPGPGGHIAVSQAGTLAAS